MPRFDLLPCRWRGPSPVNGRQACSSVLKSAGPFGVPDHECWMCNIRDHLDPDARSPRVRSAGRVRHLIYHLCPMGPAWRWHLSELLTRLPLFNGVRLISVAAGPGCADAEEVRELVRGQGVGVHVVQNDPHLREMTGYPLLLRELSRYRGADDVHLYGHAKGASSEQSFDGVREWSRTMLVALLDYWPAVRRSLADHACVGVFRRRMHLAGHPACEWHYSGSWRWARNRDWFERRWDEHQYGLASTETQPGSLFGYYESACLFGEFETGDTPLYHAAAWRAWAGKARDRWFGEHAADFRPAGSSPTAADPEAEDLEEEAMLTDHYAEALEASPPASLDQLYDADCRTHSDIAEHLATLHGLAKECSHVTELGTHIGHSTTAFLAARPAVLVCYDLVRQPAVDVLARASQGTYFQFWQKDSLQASIDPTDLLFIDTLHDYDQLRAELLRHAGQVRRYIVLHDTATFGVEGETPGHRGLWPAVQEFCSLGVWRVKDQWHNNNGLTVLERVPAAAEAPPPPSAGQGVRC